MANSGTHWTETVTLNEIVKSKWDVVQVTSKTSIEETAKLLKKKNFLSVPVWDEETREFVGIIDVIDLMTFAVLVANIKLKHQSVAEMTTEEVKKLTFANGTVADILSLPGSERRRMYVFQSHVKVANAMKILGHHDYRVLVMYGTRESSSLWFTHHKIYKYRLVTQSDIVSFLCKNFLHLDQNIIHKRIGDLNLVDKEAIRELAITLNDRAIDGFFKMLEHEASAAPVIDESGRLVTNLSASDLRGITSETLANISLPIMEFFKTTGRTARPSPIVCSIQDTLDNVMLTTVKQRVHQVWVVDEAMHPIGVVTLSDMILSSLGVSRGMYDHEKGRVQHFFDQFPLLGREG